MTQLKVVVTDFEYSDLRYEEEVFNSAGITLIPAQCRTEDELITVCKEADGLLSQYAQITRRVIESLPKCKVIGRYGVGVNTIDIEAATEKGICVVNVPDYCMDEVSDHALALILTLARKIVLLNNSVKKGIWDYKISKPIYRLRGKVLGLVGFGRIPRTLAQKAKSIGFNILVYDPYISPNDAEAYGAKLVSLDELMTQSDFISIHVPLNKETYHLIGPQELKLMKPTAFLINTARGPVIDEKALIEVLLEKRIAGAALDVTEVEPIQSDNPLLKMDNVIITPHVAWYSEEAEAELRTKAAQGIADVLLGYWPRYLVNKEVMSKINLKEKEN
ncbi:D-isomer specific 2-hydroxyacid dehydrogenase NAD-binding protein [Caldicellulosiruptor hydrothermalis 108]|uniref:D-isomer specific 2-hydroxyacid dehydrogenase NAD-binding protein n=1 Tax=Caldicellulosiruptor hydrothermalis (strain DSM 18901 / VKM B-2411 / 108) TaxID=632292 RepID=E4QCE9_CALH1|nr:C-terminal binding protein [Caldicellulosiruptor hydrothermalis]ADQ06245.1 D-isomer specific 2-hydroxyacid dehydrogenase NAD-binding protein [Caldicellulosiruptor hydrothermalis 108]